MTAIDYLTKAQKSLGALAHLLEDAAARDLPAGEFVGQAMAHLREAQQIIDAMTEDEGTQ